MIERHSPGLYVHVPFCQSKCPYCDFFSVTSRSAVGRWLRAVEREAVWRREEFEPFDTLYIGGGTPTSLTDQELAALLDGLQRNLTFAAGTEITLEANPDDLTPDRIARFHHLGIDRISLGVQSFDDGELRFLGRRSTAGQNRRVLAWIRAAGSLRLAVDLMYGFAAQTRQSWQNTLDRALQFRPEHLSCYQLTLEDGTPFGRMKAAGLIRPLPEDAQSDLFLLTSDYLEANGYIHYEVSNFARGLEHMSRHNRKYWRHAPYLGLGPAAHSFRDGTRWWNLRSIEQYCRAVESGTRPVAGSETLRPDQVELESLYLGLRTRDGVSADTIGQTARTRSVLAQLQAEGILNLEAGRIVPTTKGFLLADSLPLSLLD